MSHKLSGGMSGLNQTAAQPAVVIGVKFVPATGQRGGARRVHTIQIVSHHATPEPNVSPNRGHVPALRMHFVDLCGALSTPLLGGFLPLPARAPTRSVTCSGVLWTVRHVSGRVFGNNGRNASIVTSIVYDTSTHRTPRSSRSPKSQKSTVM